MSKKKNEGNSNKNSSTLFLLKKKKTFAHFTCQELIQGTNIECNLKTHKIMLIYIRATHLHTRLLGVVRLALRMTKDNKRTIYKLNLSTLWV